MKLPSPKEFGPPFPKKVGLPFPKGMVPPAKIEEGRQIQELQALYAQIDKQKKQTDRTNKQNLRVSNKSANGFVGKSASFDEKGARAESRMPTNSKDPNEGKRGPKDTAG